MKLTNKILEAVNQGIKFALDDIEDEIEKQTNSSKVKVTSNLKDLVELK
jgi:hypothetical protein